MTDLCRMIPYEAKTSFKKRLHIFWYHLKTNRRLVWQKSETLYRGVNKGDPGYEDAPIGVKLAWHPDAFKTLNK